MAWFHRSIVQGCATCDEYTCKRWSQTVCSPKRNENLKAGTGAVHLHGMSCHCLSQILFEDSFVPDEGLSPWRTELSPVRRFPTSATNLEISNGFLPVARPVPFILGSKRFQERAQHSNVAGGGY